MGIALYLPTPGALFCFLSTSEQGTANAELYSGLAQSRRDSARGGKIETAFHHAAQLGAARRHYLSWVLVGTDGQSNVVGFQHCRSPVRAAVFQSPSDGESNFGAFVVLPYAGVGVRYIDRDSHVFISFQRPLPCGSMCLRHEGPDIFTYCGKLLIYLWCGLSDVPG